MNRVHFTSYVRGMLGRTYSVADEDYGMHGDVRLVVVTRRADDALRVNTNDEWIRSLQELPSPEQRVLLKHMSICIQRFFANPEYLPDRVFSWPGTPQSRVTLRLALDPRKWRREANRVPER